MEVVERSSGFWVVSDSGAEAGPFLNCIGAHNWIGCFENINGDSGSIYAANIFCAKCTANIKQQCFADGTVAKMLADGDDPMDEWTFDSDEYPKCCDVTSEADCPQHCGGCGEFLKNDLTTDGEEYVRDTVRDSDDDSVALTVWKPFYDYIDYDESEENQ